VSENETKLLRLIHERAFQQDSPYRLASGDESDYYIDSKMVEVFSESAYLVGEVLYERTRTLNVDAIGGLEVGAVPLTTATVIAYHLHGKRMEGFWVRDAVKQHGTQKLIEGNLRPGSRVVIIEDVATQGNSALKAVQAVRDAGCEVVVVLALMDRLAGAGQRLREAGAVSYASIFTVEDLRVISEERFNS
jgi:orotate phosphoribosyltransferase